MALNNPSNIFADTQLAQTRRMIEYSPTKSGEYLSGVPQF